VDAVQQWPALAEAARAVGSLTVPVPTASEAEDADPTPLPTVETLTLDGIAARWPDTNRDVFAGVGATVSRGEWLIVEGPSGSGKSTLMTLLLGYLPASRGAFSLGGRDSRTIAAADLRRHIAWCPQEGHLFDSTLRGNLLLARSHEDAPTDEELLAVLRRVGLGSLIDAMPLGLDTPVGSEGEQLSGGQRQRVAVARTLLTRAKIVLLDEPTAHLDDESADALMADLRRSLSDRVVVLVTHRARDIRGGDHCIRLGQSNLGQSKSAAISL
jgi:ATP-binding cassette subfamily C protein CydCD